MCVHSILLCYYTTTTTTTTTTTDTIYYHYYWHYLLPLCYTADQLMDTIVRPVGDQNMPFSIRLLSFDNLLIPPVDHFCPVVTNSLSSKQEGQECCIGVSNTSTTTEISIADRFNGHKVSTLHLLLLLCTL